MTNIILKLIALLLPVALGYFLKKIHFFGDTDYRILAKDCAEHYAAGSRDQFLLRLPYGSVASGSRRSGFCGELGRASFHLFYILEKKE